MLRNKIYLNYFKEICKTFFAILLGLTLIALTVRAVSFLDLIVESGYNIDIYFKYSLLNIFGIATKFIPFTFLISLTIFISKHLNDKEFIILWCSGVNKISIINLFLFISILIFIINLFLSSFLAPYTLNKSRLLLSGDSAKSISPAFKIQEFSDTFKGLTFLVSKKKVNEVQNIFLHDESGNLKNLSPDLNNSSETTIIARSGYIDNSKFLLFDGQIISSKVDNKKNRIMKFEQISLDLRGFNARTRKVPKIQETSTLKLINCFTEKKFKKFCNDNAKKEMVSALNRRLVMPIYTVVIALVCSLMLMSQTSKFSNRNLIFFYGFILLLFAEMTVRYTGLNEITRIIFLIAPLLLIVLNYLFLIFKFYNKSILK